ncbi:MAG: hypothetical protein WCG48_03660 [Candidatus Berkelbacteria bacterium]
MGEKTKDPERITAVLEELATRPMAKSLVDMFDCYSSEETVEYEDRGIVSPSTVRRHRLTADIVGQRLGMILEIPPSSDNVVRLSVIQRKMTDEDHGEQAWIDILAGEMRTGSWAVGSDPGSGQRLTTGIRIHLPVGQDLVLPSPDGRWFIGFLEHFSRVVQATEATDVGNMPTYWSNDSKK